MAAIDESGRSVIAFQEIVVERPLHTQQRPLSWYDSEGPLMNPKRTVLKGQVIFRSHLARTGGIRTDGKVVFSTLSPEIDSEKDTDETKPNKNGRKS